MVGNWNVPAAQTAARIVEYLGSTLEKYKPPFSIFEFLFKPIRAPGKALLFVRGLI
jgi:hypothetical protein